MYPGAFVSWLLIFFRVAFRLCWFVSCNSCNSWAFFISEKLTLFFLFVIIQRMKKKAALIFLCCLGMTIMADNTTIHINELSKKMPAEIDGWKKSLKDTIYTPGNLFEYIDGGAELFISYNFKQMVAQKYVKQVKEEGIKNPIPITITVDIFDMGNSFNAFGVFSHSRETLDDARHRIGQESEYASGLLTFWKDKFYVSILAYPETGEKKKTLRGIGEGIAAAIPADGPLPPILSLLPAENLIKESTRYFHHYIWLNSFYFISDQNILHIDDTTDALLAKYKYKDKDKTGKYLVLLIQYPGKERAEAAHQGFLHHYLPDAQKGIKKLEDNRWTGCQLKDNLIVIVLNAPTREYVNHFFEKIKNNK